MSVGFFLTILLLVAVAWGAAYLRRIAPVGAAYKAKVLASAIFVSGRKIGDGADDVSADSYRILRLFGSRVDREARSVTVSLLGLWVRTAVHRPGFGVTLDLGPDLKPLAGGAPGESAPTPAGSVSPLAASSLASLERVAQEAFAEPHPRKLRRTRAVLVLHDSRIALERYAPGFSADTPLPGWSMAKSVLNALVGVLSREGRLSLDQKNLLAEWSSPGDPRAEIALEDLLRMRSGLRFSEIYSDLRSDVTQMLFARPDAAAFAASKPLAAPPGTSWQYASGTTNILSLILRRAVGEEEYPGFPRRALFDPLGMASAVFEPDASGTFVGSSFLLATARDWARFGQLYLQDGVWEGRRVLPESWVRMSTTPTPQSPEGRYGAHWWLKIPKELGGETGAAKRVPADAFHALGHEGQTLTVIPSRRLVVVRLGLSIFIDAWNHAAFLADLLDALPARA